MDSYTVDHFVQLETEVWNARSIEGEVFEVDEMVLVGDIEELLVYVKKRDGTHA